MKTIPKVIALYIKASNGKDATLYASAFTTDATYLDEGKIYTGENEIKKWKENFDKELTVNSELVNFTNAIENHYFVSIRVSGNFPGSPQVFEHSIILENDKIKEMKIL